MVCFHDYIGLSLCAGAYEVPASGIYINSLPGLNIESIDKIADQEQINYIGVWEDVQTNAMQQFRVDVIAEMMKCSVGNSKSQLHKARLKLREELREEQRGNQATGLSCLEAPDQ